MSVRLTLFAAVLFVGFLAHVRAAARAAVGEEGMLWVWTKAPETRGEHWARYTFYIWLASCFVSFLPIDLKVAAGISGFVLFAHLATVTFRDW